MSKIGILLVDDHAVVRLGLRTLIEDEPTMQVVGEAGTTAEAVRAVERLRPDVVLMDVRIPGEGGIEATRLITERFPQSKILVLTSFADEDLVVRAVRAGARGYILKQVANEELLRAIHAVARGEAITDASTTARLLNRIRETERKLEEDAFRDLSEREMEVVVEVARGRTNGEIGEILHLGERTVRNYISTILEKLHLNNRIELATYAVKHHISEQFEENK